LVVLVTLVELHRSALLSPQQVVPAVRPQLLLLLPSVLAVVLVELLASLL
jgi:hypothetical protein